MSILLLLHVISPVAAVIIYSEKGFSSKGCLCEPNTTQIFTYGVTNMLSSSSKSVTVYLEPGHEVVDTYSWPFANGLSRSFNFTCPDPDVSAASYSLVFYDSMASGVSDYPTVTVESVRFSVGNETYWGC
ncbi:hypothetical protein HDU84_007006 [Entophlyctis sp. JEL0112]|nr:hypothetical protein HDU84_007006 [Entophlyctis sp. JEL0112]